VQFGEADAGLDGARHCFIGRRWASGSPCATARNCRSGSTALLASARH
jgi:hypothetical protein